VRTARLRGRCGYYEEKSDAHEDCEKEALSAFVAGTCIRYNNNHPQLDSRFSPIGKLANGYS
jgi:hypothetical protein